MNVVAKLSSTELEELFTVTARKIKVPEAMIEKDFWVCWTLNYLFHECRWAPHLAFKGGTSLSKCYGLIERFSEDIDLILDWRILGYTNGEPWATQSKTKQDRLNKEVDSKTAVFLREVFLPEVQKDFSKFLTTPFSLYVDEDEPQTVNFAYPKIFEDSAILNVVRLEIGALAAWTPTKDAVVTSYAAECYPKLFVKPSTHILTVAAERTFWEKLTILHKEAYRTNAKFPVRYSRHYYDLYCMDKSPVKQAAYQDLSLLERVVVFKDRFYPTGAARYDIAHPGTMKLIPPADCIPILSDDYDHMQNMIFGKIPSFEEIMKCMKRLENEINGL